MSLVNAMVNQIGREIGRDLYWSARRNIASQPTRVQRSSRTMDTLSVNEQLLQMVNKKSWNNRMRFEAMAEDIAETIQSIDDKIDPQSFNWQEVYEVLDQKIDDLKLNCQDNEAPSLEELDKKNFIGFSISLQRHKKWIEKEINQKKSLPAPPSGFIIFLMSCFGIASFKLQRGAANIIAETLLILICWGAIIIGLNLFSHSQLALYGLLSVALGIAFFLFTTIGNFISLNKLKTQYDNDQNQIRVLEHYMQRIS